MVDTTATVSSADRRRVAAAMIGAALMPLNSTMIAVAVPDVAEHLGHGPTLVTQALVTSYLVAAIVLQSPGGTLADRVGPGRMLVAGQLLVATGALLGWVAPSLVALVGARLLIAAGGAVLVPTTVAVLRLTLPPERRGRAFGAFGGTMSLAAAIGPLLGGELVEAFGWRSVFVANLPVLAASATLLVLAGPGSARPPSPIRGPRFDWAGTALLAAGLGTTVIGLRPGADHAAALLTVGAAVLVAFVLWERRVAAPVVALGLLRIPSFAAGTVLVAVQNLAMYALVFQLPIVLGVLLDLDARATGRLLVAMTAAMAVGSVVAGRLVDRAGPRTVAVAGSVLALGGVVGLGVVATTSQPQVALPLVALGLGLGLTMPAAQAASVTDVPEERTGMAAGLGSTMRYLGGVVGVAVMSRVLDADGSAAEVLAEHRRLVVVFGAALVVGLCCALTLPRAETRQAVKSRERRARRIS